MQNAHIPRVKNGNLGISSIKSIRNLYILTLSPRVKMWYVMHGVIWAYSAHDACCFFRGSGPSGRKNGVFFVVRSVSAGGRAFSQEAAGVTPWGVPRPIRKNE